MTPHDTAGVLGILAAAFPRETITEQTAAVWREMLAGVEQADGVEAARVIVRRSEWFPSIARFLIEAEAAAQARRSRDASSRGLPRTDKPVAPPPAVVANLRTHITDIGARKHWHGGPKPCPICGGMKETFTKETP